MEVNKKGTKPAKTLKKESRLKQLNKKILIYITLLILAIYLGYTIYLLIKQPTDIFTIEEGELYQEETCVGYIIRDEQVIQGENYKNGMEQIKAEGEKVAKGEAAFRYYSKNEERLKMKIAELDTKIQDAMANETNLFSSDIKILENQIDEKLDKMRNVTDISKLTEYKKEISDLVIKKAKIAGELSPQKSYLKQLITQRSTYETELNSGAEYIKAPKSGIVSYKVDGLEEQLTPNSFSTISKKYLENLNLKTGKIIATNEECGKIIDNFTSYIATITNSEYAKNAKVGDKVKVRLSNNIEVNSQVEYISQENEDEMLIILKLDKQISELTNYRKITFDLIWWKYSGLKVPNQAIVEQDGLNYVVRNRAGYLSKIVVNVEKQNDNYAIVRSYETEELNKLGFSEKDINQYKRISIYDEILINPDLTRAE